MGSQVLTDAYVSIAGNDISAYVKSVGLEYQAEVHDETAMGDTHRNKIAGLKDWSLSLQLINDHAAAALESILFPLVGTSVAVIVRPDSDAVSTSNPEYTGNAIVESFSPLQGNIGDLSETSVNLPGNGDLSRATS